jgi:hypothetical protein
MRATSIITPFLLLLPDLGAAHGLDCNQQEIQFNEPINHNFTVSDLLGSQISWGTIPSCGVGGNVATGDGEAACVAADMVLGTDTTLESLDFYLGCKANAELSFTVNFQNPSSSATLALEVMASGSTSWSNVATWNNTLGASTGVPISVSLTPFAGSGFAETRVRWRFTSGAASNTFVQLDNISLSCVDGASADLDLRLLGDLGPLPIGAVRRYQINVSNFGPVDVADGVLELQLPAAVSVLELNGLTPQLGNQQEFNATLGVLNDGSGRSFDALLKFNSGGAKQVSAMLSTAVCDIRTNNNQRGLLIDIDADSAVPSYLKEQQAILTRLVSQVARMRTNCPANRRRAIKAKVKTLVSAETLDGVYLMNPEVGPEVEGALLKVRRVARALSITNCQTASVTRIIKALKLTIQQWNKL